MISSIQHPVKYERSAAYEFIRFVAVSLVLIVHTAQIFAGNSLINTWYPVFELGKHGVCLFFVLSGYLLSRSLAETTCSVENYKKYLIRRLMRIYPAYVLVLAFLVLIQKPSIFQIFTHVFLIHTITRETFGGINYPFWSLSVEFLTYLTIPFFVWISRRYKSHLLIGLPIILGIAWQTVGGYFREKNGFDTEYQISSLLFIITTIPAFVLGVYAREIRSNSGIINFAKFACLPIFLFDLIGALIKSINGKDIRTTLFNNLMHGSTSYFIYGAVFLLLIFKIEENSFNRIIQKPLVKIGKISYSIYLIHVPILLYFEEKLGTSFLVAFLAIGAIILLSAIIYSLIERPFMTVSTRMKLRYEN